MLYGVLSFILYIAQETYIGPPLPNEWQTQPTIRMSSKHLPAHVKRVFTKGKAMLECCI
jgi:hypothetical protein